MRLMSLTHVSFERNNLVCGGLSTSRMWNLHSRFADFKSRSLKSDPNKSKIIGIEMVNNHCRAYEDIHALPRQVVHSVGCDVGELNHEPLAFI